MKKQEKKHQSSSQLNRDMRQATGHYGATLEDDSDSEDELDEEEMAYMYTQMMKYMGNDHVQLLIS